MIWYAFINFKRLFLQTSMTQYPNQTLLYFPSDDLTTFYYYRNWFGEYP